MAGGFINILMLVVVFYLVYTVTKIDERMKGLQYRIERIAEQVGVQDNLLDQEIAQLLTADKEVVAVKQVRETLGLTLVEAKEYVDRIKSNL